ncbi:MAG: phosphate ABC transporter ATP-binding protein [Ardenticatenaceae bacterium]|nr:phosphate ABC transporter ATP-binding protein [Ardenticatenaceae bacterium]HBY96419.1 phosphate ABC transporter ATP-binding protein [Chloroflexota bacterium]
MTGPLYELNGVTKQYRQRTVVDIEHLAVMPGEVLALVGPSGAGKSTLLRLLNFLEAPDSGDLRYRGASVPYPPGPSLAVRREVTTVFQRPVLLSRSVMENVVYGLRLRGERNSTPTMVRLLDDLGLDHLADAPAHVLSGGEMQRVALARALVLKPRALLLDEPTANLDPANIAIIERMIRVENEVRGTTIVIVTHNVFQARRLAHRTALLLEGQLVEVAPTERFFQHPSDPRTTAFVTGEILY